MLHLFYNISIAAYVALIRLVAPFNSKAAKWVSGRRGWKGKLKTWRTENPGRLWWMHCASLGEFEQGRPVLEAIRQRHPDWKVVLTFFSPSGYEVRKNYSGADLVIYLPADTPAQSRAFVELLDPGFVVFVKYEYWANYFISCQKKGIPIFMASAILRPGQRFFGVFSGFWKKVLACVDRFFVQDKRTMELLADLGFNNTVLCGDTRFDRVVEVKRTAKPDEGVSQFVGERICIVAGSTWPADDKLLTQWLSQKKKSGLDYRMILVPHEIAHFDHEALDGTGLTLVRWSQRTNDTWENADILLVDVMGQLSSLYRFGRLAYIGGGFGKGIHNTLEAAVWGIPVVFGPNYGKFLEAIDLMAAGAAYSIHDAGSLARCFDQLLEDPAGESGRKAGAFVTEKAGATALVVKGIEEQVFNLTL